MTTISPLAPSVPIIDPRTGVPSVHFAEFLRLLWLRTGGDDDGLDEIRQGELYEVGVTPARQTEQGKRLDNLDAALAVLVPASRADVQALRKDVQALAAQVESFTMLPGRLRGLTKRLEALESEVDMMPGFQSQLTALRKELDAVANNAEVFQ